METLESNPASLRVENLMKNLEGKKVGSRSIEKAAKRIALETKTKFKDVLEMISSGKK